MLAELAFGLVCPDPAGSGLEAGWLARRRAALEAHAGDATEAWEDWVRDPAASDERLRGLAGTMGLSAVETIALALAVAVELDPMAARVMDWLQRPVAGARPTVGLLARLAHRVDDGDPAAQIEALVTGRAAEAGVLRTETAPGPVAQRSVAAPLPLVLALSGGHGRWPGVQGRLATPPPLPPSIVEAAGRHALACRSERVALVVRSGDPREARAAAQLIAEFLEGEPAFFEGEPPAGFGPWLWLTRGVPVLSVEAAPGERRTLPTLSGYPGPLLVAAGRDGSFTLDGEAVVAWSLGIPEAAERMGLWRAATGDQELSESVARHRHGSARIQGLARAARYQASLSGDDAPRIEHVETAARQGAAVDLGHMAELLPEAIEDEAIILSSRVRDDLERLSDRCRQRDRLTSRLGPAARARYRPGVRALFHGPSGTGKTLAAGWLATRLGLPLYRVDLASVTSKYIGETEKNLAELFSRAEHAEVVLLFDEADALFGRRTDVKDANDRFANAQTNYLLQRIESFEGIALLTSNSRSRFDSGFARRLDVLVDFPMPGPEERKALWRAHLGSGVEIGPTELNRLAAGCELAGGHVRNAVLHAAVAARARGEHPSFQDLAEGVAAEFRKLGRQPPVFMRSEA